MRYGLLDPSIGNSGGGFAALVQIVDTREIAHGHIEYKVRRFKPAKWTWTKGAKWGAYSVLVLPAWMERVIDPLRR